ncbi:WD40 repeat domain-containing protein [Rhodobacteraceae bacterium DSL-40]|uniref:WD40 repeat domain-containing protein n=1 Tax=Amaricoccus sp. B4 TaxID=3368557 RepID=UPI0013A6E2E9
MEETLTRAPTLYDLLAREWGAGSPVGALLFNADGSAVAAGLEDGSVALARLEDEEAPEKRLRLDFETGRTTIRPRERPPAPLARTEPLGEGAPVLAAFRDTGFAAGTSDGRILQITPRGQVVRLRAGDGRAILGLDRAAPRGGQPGRLAAATAGGVCILDEDTLETVAEIDTDAPVSGIAFSPDGQALAIAQAGGVSIWSSSGGAAPVLSLAVEGKPSTLRWSAAGDLLIAGCAEGGIEAIWPAEGAQARIEGPAPGADLALNQVAGAVIASGGLRPAAWALPATPKAAARVQAIATGSPGIAAIDAVTTHPDRALSAFGYANGLVQIAQVGKADELVVRPGDGAAVRALAWSRDGRHMAIGTARGNVALVAFPKNMFK